MAELINKDELLKKAVMIPGPSGKSVFSVVFTDDILNAKSIEPTTKNDLVVDCIDRAELLKAMATWDKFGNDPDVGLIPLRTPALQDRYVPYVHYYDIFNCVKGMSSVTPIRPKGHWIPTYGNVKCSVCGSVKDSREVGKATHYCDFCGAKMESEDKE